MRIPFNKPYISGKEIDYIRTAVQLGKLSGNGLFTNNCQAYFIYHYGFKKTLLTTSGTAALEMAAILADIKAGDEVIMPSYTFVSIANTFAMRGAEIVFADSSPLNPNMDAEKIEALITAKTKAIVPVHYAGIACDMDKIMLLAKQHKILVIEDAAHAIDAFYKGKALGSIGNFGAFSFHETKNIISGEGGMIAINDENFNARAEIVWENGTNRAAFFRGEVDKYEWVDAGSSFLPSEITASFLNAQLEQMEKIQTKRVNLWNNYFKGLKELEKKEITLPFIPDYATNNGHIFYLVCRNLQERTKLILHLDARGITAVFHNISLHKSPYYLSMHEKQDMPNADRYSDCLLRLPMYYKLSQKAQAKVIEAVLEFYRA